jgi:hypothetical protein
VFATSSFGVGFVLHQDIKYILFFSSIETANIGYPFDLGQEFAFLGVIIELYVQLRFYFSGCVFLGHVNTSKSAEAMDSKLNRFNPVFTVRKNL